VGFEPRNLYKKVDSFTNDMVELDLKVWHAWAYYDQDDYLRSVGSSEKYLNYAGHGEIRVKIRNAIPWPWDNQLDLSTRIFHGKGKNAFMAEFQQNIPWSNFSLYVQYWRGYDENLLHFDRFVRNYYGGLSFSY